VVKLKLGDELGETLILGESFGVMLTLAPSLGTLIGIEPDAMLVPRAARLELGCELGISLIVRATL
jgi:hypothetical protein